jgi:hypothetical protein
MADMANPNDPSQIRNWASGVSAQNANRGLYDNLDQIRSLLTPMFQQQQSNYASKFGGAMNSQIGQAQNQAGAYAAFKGLNPMSYTNSAAQKVRSSMTPSYMSGLQDLLSGQQNSLMGATAQNNQFQSQNAQSYAQQLMNQAGQAQQTWDQPGFWSYLGSGLMQALPSLAGFLVGGPAGAAVGGGLGNMMSGGSGNYK